MLSPMTSTTIPCVLRRASTSGSEGVPFSATQIQDRQQGFGGGGGFRAPAGGGGGGGNFSAPGGGGAGGGGGGR